MSEFIEQLRKKNNTWRARKWQEGEGACTLDEKWNCNIGNCGRSGDNYIINDGKMIPVCDSHYEQVKKIGMQFEKASSS